MTIDPTDITVAAFRVALAGFGKYTAFHGSSQPQKLMALIGVFTAQSPSVEQNYRARTGSNP